MVEAKRVGMWQGVSFSPFFLFFFFFSFLFLLLRATPAACGGSQARGLIGAVAASLHQSRSNARSEPHLRPTRQHQILDPLREARD